MICHFLNEIKKTYRWSRKELHLVLDNAKYNRAYETQDHANELGIELDFLPVSAPNLNVIERFWKFLKKKVCKNKYYSSFQKMLEELNYFLANLDIHEKELKSLLNLNFEIIQP